jgi:hypothetical protein
MSDVILESGPTPPNSYYPIAAVDTVPGSPVYPSADDKVSLAIGAADPNGHAFVTGIAFSAAKAGNRVFVRYAGPITLTAAEWLAVSADAEALQPGKLYYVSPANAGKITKAKPEGAGQYVAPIGIAIDGTTLLVVRQLVTKIAA